MNCDGNGDYENGDGGASFFFFRMYVQSDSSLCLLSFVWQICHVSAMLPSPDPEHLRFVVFAHICVLLQLLTQKALFHILLVILLFVSWSSS